MFIKSLITVGDLVVFSPAGFCAIAITHNGQGFKFSVFQLILEFGKINFKDWYSLQKWSDWLEGLENHQMSLEHL